MPNLKEKFAMTFINPIEILELQDADNGSIDNLVIKKAKRKLFADIELSDDGQLNYKGLSLQKADCEKVIDELDNSSLFEFYRHLVTNTLLNDYLANGNEKLFASFKQDSIYKLPEFVIFISPFFASKFDKSLVDAYSENDEYKFKSILRTQILINNKDLNTAYKSLSHKIQLCVEQVDKITCEIKNEESEYDVDDIDQVIDVVEELFPAELLNQLPAYFQSQINKVAASINFLQLAVWNEFNTTIVSLGLLEYLLKLNIDSVSKPTFQKNYDIVKKKHENVLEQEKNSIFLKKWAAILLNLQSLVKQIETKTLKANEAFDIVKSQINISELNSLPSFANEIRTQLGYSLRSLSISFWNSQNNLIDSISLIDFALQIDMSPDDFQKLNQDKNELIELQKKYVGIFICFFCGENAPDEKSILKLDMYQETGRNNFISKRTVNYSHIEISVPRCKSCCSIHQEIVKKSNLAFLVIPIVFVITVYYAFTNTGDALGDMIYAIFIGCILAAMSTGISLFAYGIIERILYHSQTIKQVSNLVLSNHPLIKSKITSGWTFIKPTA